MFVTGLHKLNVEDTRKVLGTDSLAFLPQERLRGMLGDAAPTFCDAYFSGAYVVPLGDLTRFKEETLKPIGFNFLYYRGFNAWFFNEAFATENVQIIVSNKGMEEKNISL